MSMMGGRLPAGFDETGQTVASFARYEAAQKAVSQLIAGDIPAKHIAIVGTGLRSIERVTGKLGFATAARSGAINGLFLGLVFSAIFVIGTPSPPIQLFVGVLLVGVAIGMLLSIFMFALVRRRRDYASVAQVVADHYDVTVSSENVHRAREILGTLTVVARPAPEPDLSVPPRYGERIPAAGATPPAAPPAGDAPASTDPGSAPEGDVVETEDGLVIGPEEPEAPRA